MYFIHNKYDKESVEMLEGLPDGTTVIDLFGMRQEGNRVYGDLDRLKVSELPCLLERLEFLPEGEIPPRLPTPEEAMQAKLDYLMMMAE